MIYRCFFSGVFILLPLLGAAQVDSPEIPSEIPPDLLELPKTEDEETEDAIELFIEEERFFDANDQQQEEYFQYQLEEMLEEEEKLDATTEHKTFESKALDGNIIDPIETSPVPTETPSLPEEGVLESTPIQTFQAKAALQVDDDEADARVKTIAEPEEEDAPEGRLVVGPSQYDSRVETRALNATIDWQIQIRTNAQSVGIVVERNKIHAVSDKRYQLDIATTLSERYNLCPREAFGTQPIIGVGTAFIVDDQTMASALHVLESDADNYAIIFGFEMVNKVGAYESLIPKENVYFIKRIKKRQVDLDVVTFETDRPLNRPALGISKQPVENNVPVYMIGHPMGLPQKVAMNARVRTNDHPNYFFTSLDAFQGNSGSPVFRLDTHEVIGILVSGELDYRWNGTCNASTLCRIPYCEGEKVMRTLQIQL